jgi:hypothetical protein
MKDVWEDLVEAASLKLVIRVVPKEVGYVFSWIQLADDWGLRIFCF